MQRGREAPAENSRRQAIAAAAATAQSPSHEGRMRGCRGAGARRPRLSMPRSRLPARPSGGEERPIDADELGAERRAQARTSDRAKIIVEIAMAGFECDDFDSGG